MWQPALNGDVDQSLVRRAQELKPLVAEHAARTEAQRQVVPEVMEALDASGLLEVIVQKRVGGLGATMATQIAIAAELGEACASTAWVQTLLNVTTWAAARSPAASEVFGDGLLPRVCGVVFPSGNAVFAPGGYTVSGRWPFASASFYAEWFVGGVRLVDESGEVCGAGMITVPIRDFSIEDSWFVAGMCGTASNTVVLEEVFVPESRFSPLSEGSLTAGDEPADLWPLGTVLTLILMGPLLGVARSCVDMLQTKAPSRGISYTRYGATTDSMVALSQFASACLDIETAWLHASQAAGYVDSVGAGNARDLAEEARVRGQCGYLSAMLRQGVGKLLDIGGAGSFASANAMQRHWRDLNVGSRHAFLATNVALETYGRSIFGLDPIVAIV